MLDERREPKLKSGSELIPMVDYLKHWLAKGPVFTSAPDTDSLFFSKDSMDFVERLRVGFSQGLQIMSLSGTVGSGKSTVLRWLYDNLDPEKYECLMLVLFKAETNTGWLAPRLAGMLGAKISSNSADANAGAGYIASLSAISQRMDEVRAEGRKIAILIDCAERLCSAAALDEISALADANISGSSVVSVLLSGSDEFQNHFRDSASAIGSQLRSRIGLIGRLPGLENEQVSEYISKRLTSMGLRKDLFTPEAADMAARLANGNIHLLNSICENALVHAAEIQATGVTVDSIQNAARLLVQTQIHKQTAPKNGNDSPGKTMPAEVEKQHADLQTGQKPKQTPPSRSRDMNPEADVPIQSLFKNKNPSARKKDK